METFTGRMLKRFYALEGIDGAGKTTLVKALKELCDEKGAGDVLVMHAEPTDNYIGLACRNMISSGKAVYPPSVAAYLFAADRYSHLYAKKDGVLALLEQGKMVLTDRYIYSSIVYQACMEDSRESLPQRRKLATLLNKDFEIPEIFFFLECSPELALERQRKRGEDSIDSIGRLAHLDKQYQRCFARLEALREWERQDYPLDSLNIPAVVRLDAGKSAEELARQVHDEIFK